MTSRTIVFCATSLTLAISVTGATTAGADPTRRVVTWVPMTCTFAKGWAGGGAGGLEFKPSTVTVFNNGSATIPAGTKGEVQVFLGNGLKTLPFRTTSALAPNGGHTVEMSTAGGVSCSNAKFDAGVPKLAAKSLKSAGPTTIVEIDNGNPWVDAKSVIVRLTSFTCAGVTITQLDSKPLSVPKGSTASTSFGIVPGGAVSYVRATIDPANDAGDATARNNVRTSPIPAGCK